MATDYDKKERYFALDYVYSKFVKQQNTTNNKPST